MANGKHGCKYYPIGDKKCPFTKDGKCHANGKCKPAKRK